MHILDSCLGLSWPPEHHAVKLGDENVPAAEHLEFRLRSPLGVDTVAMYTAQLFFFHGLAASAICELVRDVAQKPIDFRFLLVNHAFTTMVGRADHELVGRTYQECFPELGFAWVERYAQVVRTRQPMHCSCQLAPQSARWFEVQAVPLDGDRFAVSVVEISDRVELHREQRRTLIALRDALRAAESSTIAKAHFLSVMSHEIRTPLTGIMGMADILGEVLPDPDHRAMAHVIKDCGQTLLAIVSDVLDLARIEAGGLALDLQPVDIRRLTEGVHAHFAPQAQAKGLRLLLDIAPSVPTTVIVDATRVTQILRNYVNNAVKFTAHGSVSIRLDLASPRTQDPLTLEWEVLDTGPGIPCDILPRIWEPFFQGDSSLARQHEGTGLGLAICRRLADVLGGEVSVESTVGRGSSFRLRLPVKVALNSAVLPCPGDSATPSTSPLPWSRTPRILVVDDDPTCQLAIRLMLSSLGCRLDQANDGEQAIQLARCEAYDLILMDLQMPVCDGYQATERLRAQQSAGRRVPIIAVSANAFTEHRERASAAGMDDFIAKPLLLPTLRQCLRKHLEHLLTND